MKLGVTDIRIVGRVGSNNRPHSGNATFSDGKTYDFMVDPDGDGISFFVTRKRYDSDGKPFSNGMVSFRSKARESALLQYWRE